MTQFVFVGYECAACIGVAHFLFVHFGEAGTAGLNKGEGIIGKMLEERVRTDYLSELRQKIRDEENVSQNKGFIATEN